MVFQSVIEKKKMDEVSVGAAASTSVVDLSGDSHLQVETQDLTWLLIWVILIVYIYLIWHLTTKQSIYIFQQADVF